MSAPARIVAALLMLVVGSALVAARGVASPARQQSEGTLRVVGDYDIDSIDPSLGISKVAWQVGYATGLTLVRRRDAGPPRGWELVLDAAARPPRISRDGRVYTFELRPGLRFSNGRPVRAANFAYALNRSLSKRLGSPGSAFLTASPGVAGIVGANAVVDGKRRRASGISARGNELVVRLTRPDATFLLTFSLPLFQAIPLGLPRDRGVENVAGPRGLPSAGPYYVSEFRTDQRLVLRRNPHYRGNRPHRLAAIEFGFGIDSRAAYEQVESGAADYTLDLPTDVHAVLGAKYGIRQGRYRVNPLGCVLSLGFYVDRPLFVRNPQLRQAVNFAIDRQALVAAYESLFGAYAASATDQYVPPGFPGFRDATIYPLGAPDLDRAHGLADGRTRAGTAVYTAYQNATSQRLLGVVQTSLAKIGLEVQSAFYRRRRAAGDIRPVTLCSSTPDASAFLKDVFLDGVPSAVERSIDQASRLGRAARLRRFGSLDAQIARTRAPAVAWGSLNNREFFSDRVVPGSIVYQPFVGGVDFAALAVR